MADEQTVTTSEKLWSEEVASADDSKEDKTAYEFTNGRKFESAETLYASGGVDPSHVVWDGGVTTWDNASTVWTS